MTIRLRMIKTKQIKKTNNNKCQQKRVPKYSSAPCAAKGTLAADLSLTANALLVPSAPLPLPLAQKAPLTAL